MTPPSLLGRDRSHFNSSPRRATCGLVSLSARRSRAAAALASTRKPVNPMRWREMADPKSRTARSRLAASFTVLANEHCSPLQAILPLSFFATKFCGHARVLHLANQRGLDTCSLRFWWEGSATVWCHKSINQVCGILVTSVNSTSNSKLIVSSLRHFSNPFVHRHRPAASIVHS